MMGFTTLFQWLGGSALAVALAFGIGRYQGHKAGVELGFGNGYERAIANCRKDGGEIVVPDEDSSWWDRWRKRRRNKGTFSPVPKGFEGVHDGAVGDCYSVEDTGDPLEPIPEPAIQEAAFRKPGCS